MLRIRPPLPQLRAHNPCGHWHKGGGDTARSEERFAANCWEPTIATDGARALYVITGRLRPNEIYMLRYEIPQNTWATLFIETDILHSNWDGGASIADNVHAFHNFAYDISGEQYNEITSNPRMRTYVSYAGDVHVKDWPSSIELHGRNKVAVTPSGIVACIIRTSTAWQVHGSINYGVSYSLLYTLPGTVNDAAITVNHSDGIVYVAAIETSVDVLRVYSGTSTGTGWALKSTTTTLDQPSSLRFHHDGTRFFVTVSTAGGILFYYSTNNCTSFTSKNLMAQSVHFAATEKLLYNLANETDFRTTDYEAASISWTPINQFGTETDRCTVHNAGQITVYSQAKLRVDGSEGNIVAILLSRNLGERWDEIQTPLNYYETFEETLNLGDDPRWPFVPQYAKL